MPQRREGGRTSPVVLREAILAEPQIELRGAQLPDQRATGVLDKESELRSPADDTSCGGRALFEATA